MNEEIRYFSIHANTMNPCFLTHEALAEARQTWMCSGCASPKQYAKILDVFLQERRPADKPLNLVYGAGIPLVHRELLELLGDDAVQHDLYLGRVIGVHGKELTDWVTARGRRQVIVRGSKEASCRVCEQCGRTLYFAQGNRFLYPQPPGDTTIFESDLCGFVVPKRIADRVATKTWRRLRIEPLPVLDPPPDGLGTLPGR